jgi:hypothetical protein
VNREDIIRMARNSGFEIDCCSLEWHDRIERFASLVAEHEREECAKWADLVAREIDNTHNTASYIASGIRARGKK